MTPFEILSTVLGISTLALMIIGWFLNSLINQHKELNKAKSETTDTKFDGLIQRLDDLVTQIGHLFRDQEVVTESVKMLATRLAGAEKNVAAQCILCKEREKSMTDKFKVLHNRVTDLRGEFIVSSMRRNDKLINDRTDREN